MKHTPYCMCLLVADDHELNIGIAICNNTLQALLLLKIRSQLHECCIFSLENNTPESTTGMAYPFFILRNPASLHQLF